MLEHSLRYRSGYETDLDAGGTLDDVADDQSIGQMSTAVGAKIRGGIKAVGRLAVKRDVPREFIHQQPSAEADIRSATLQDPVLGWQASAFDTSYCISDNTTWLEGDLAGVQVCAHWRSAAMRMSAITA